MSINARTTPRPNDRGTGPVIAARRSIPASVWFCALTLAILLNSSAQANHVHMHGGPFIGVVLAVVIDSADPRTMFVLAHGGGVFRSKSGGASWVAVNNGLPNRRVFSLLRDPQNRGRLYLGTDEGLFLSEDEGNAWRLVPGALAKRNIRSLVVDPHDSRSLYVATDQGVLVGRNNKWKPLKTGMPPEDVRVVVADSRGEVLAGAFGGVYRLGRSGDRWHELATGLSDTRIRALAIDPSSPGTIYAGTATSGVFKTTNDGKNWQEFNRGLLNSTVMTLLHVPSAKPTLYVGTVDGIFESKNGKNQWQSIGPDLPFTVSAIAYNPKYPRLLYAGSGGRLYVSHDGGTKWRENSSEINYFGTVSHSTKR